MKFIRKKQNKKKPSHKLNIQVIELIEKAITLCICLLFIKFLPINLHSSFCEKEVVNASIQSDKIRIHFKKIIGERGRVR